MKKGGTQMQAARKSVAFRTAYALRRKAAKPITPASKSGKPAGNGTAPYSTDVHSDRVTGQ
jgi:hypothetical protein